MIFEKGQSSRAERGFTLTEDMILQFAGYLRDHEKSPATIDKYTRDIRTFMRWMDTLSEPHITRAAALRYKEYLRDHYRLTSANSMLSALNTFFRTLGRPDCCVAIYKIQRDPFRSTDRDLSLREYRQLVRAACTRTGRAAKGGRQLALIMETLAGTGIRVSELPFITLAALAARRAAVSLKGKTRTVLLNTALCRKLRAYCKDRGITAGPVFVTRTGRPLDRSTITRRMKNLAAHANVPPARIFPHNLRHLFAVTYYEREKDVVRLADILGHANINTPRIYTMVTCETQLGILDSLGKILNPEKDDLWEKTLIPE